MKVPEEIRDSVKVGIIIKEIIEDKCANSMGDPALSKWSQHHSQLVVGKKSTSVITQVFTY